jgi:hypothetical protein
VVDDAHTLVGEPGAVGWSWDPFPDSIFVNLTPSIANPAAKRAIPEIIELVVHEAVHTLDRRPGASSTIERYKTEFRAYWMSGAFDAHGTGVNPAMSNQGPKSPRARAIFDFLYGSSTYRFVKPAYDGNTSHFREQVDAYIVPDGINLIVSVRLEALRARIQSFGGANFAAHRAQVQALFAACNADDRREISGNQAWRTLVEDKYAVAQRPLIKTDLSIPA